MLPVESPFKVYTGLNGLPLSDGFIYFGTANQNPITSPITVYWDAAGTQPAAQPLRTESGYIVRAGTPANVFVSTAYSEIVKDSTGRQVFYSRTSNDYSIADAILAIFAASGGSLLMGWIQAGVGAVLRTVQSKLRDIPNIRDFGGTVDGVADDKAALAALAVGGDIELRAGNMSMASGVSFAASPCMIGHGSTTKFTATAGFTAATDMFTVTPVAGGGVEKRNIQFANFQVSNAGTNVKNVFTLDITNVGQYLNKFTIANVIADTVTGYFVELINPTNVDGLFSSIFIDNWSLNGYRLNNVGDSVFCIRNTISGTAGVAFYVNQLGTASHIVMRDNNITANGGGLYARKSMNLRFDNNQCEVPVVFAGANDAVVSFDSATAAASHQNPQVTNNSINTQANATTRCIYATWTNGLVIDGNTLFCNVATGAHIYIDANANDTYIGINKYYNSATGAEVTTPLITDLGVGTMGIWKDATLITAWTLISAANGFPVGYFKGRDGMVQLRGNLSGAAPGSGMLLFTLPIGFRPKTKVFTMYKPFSGTANVAFQIEANGNVTLLTGTATAIYLDGVVFSTR